MAGTYSSLFQNNLANGLIALKKGSQLLKYSRKGKPKLCPFRLSNGLIVLKKGSQLIKYSRKGKPKLCPFRLSNDESTLIWLSHQKERNIKLAYVTQIIPGQRTPVFKRYPRPEKDYLSFSLLYNNGQGQRSLDLICKNQAELEVWFTGLSSLISTSPRRRLKYDAQVDGRHSDDGDSVDGVAYGGVLEISASISRLHTKAFGDLYAREPSLNFRRSDVGLDHANMHPRTSNGDVSRLSVSSAPSCSSQGSGHDDIESLGDVYVWGEVWTDGILLDGRNNYCVSKTDVLLPKPLESNVVLDVHQIACGYRHVALVTRQGEVFTWGEEDGGRLGHGTDTDLSRPRLVESLALCNVDSVACGEYHTCAITTAGDFFTWGDGVHSSGLLGHGIDISHWIPKRVSGPLEGLQVLSVACGTWHSALATANGKIFTFGDGAFGALGHGDRESVAYPKEIESLSGLRTIKVACGVWHTAAIVEVIGQTGVNVVSRKLFTWGDGDKYRLGHGDKEARLVPTCVPSLIDYNFHQLACGHSITIALTTSGHVFTMGSSMHGQLGNPQSDGKAPCLVQDRLVGELVEDIACGSQHVVVLTSRSEVYTWGRGANGRLGHGDIDDRKTPTLVDALKDRHVKSISCGSNFTACICIHKWVSGADQSVCTGCRQAFGFTRKRHNCYNCGLVHCHSCSSKKVLKAALAPTPGKPHRVCDSCYSKLKAAESGISSTVSRKTVVSRQSIDTRDKFNREVRFSRLLLAPIKETERYYDVRYCKNEMPANRSSQVSSFSQLKDITFPSTLSALQTALRPIMAPTPPPLPPPVVSSRPLTPNAWKSNPLQFVTPDFSGSLVEKLKKSNEHLDGEVLKLQGQVKSLKQKLEHQEIVAQKASKKAEEASFIAASESTKLKAAVEFIKTMETQMKDMEDKLPGEPGENLKQLATSAKSFLESNKTRVWKASSTSMSSKESAYAVESHRDKYTTEGSAHGNSAINYPKDAAAHDRIENGSRTPGPSTKTIESHGEVELTEQFEPGVYVTLVRLQHGAEIFKRVRFSKRRFAEQQAAEWWSKNQERVYKKYGYPSNSTSTLKGEAASSSNCT